MPIEFAALVGVLHALGIRRIKPRFDSGFYFVTLFCPYSPAGTRAVSMIEKTAQELDGAIVFVPRAAMKTDEFEVYEIIGSGHPDELAVQLAQHCASGSNPHEETESCEDTADLSQ